MDSNDNGVLNWLWYLFIAISGMAGVYNLKKAFNKPDVSTEIKLLEMEIKHLKQYNDQLEKKILQYQNIIKNDSTTERKLE